MMNFANTIIDGIDNVASALGAGRPIKHISIGLIPHYAMGTDFHPGGAAIVGERGPEMALLPRGTRVLPAGPTAALMGGIPGYAGGIGIGDILGWLGGGVKSIIDHVLGSMNAPSIFGLNIASHVFDMVKGWASSFIGGILPKVNPFGGGGGSFTAKGGNFPGNLMSWIGAAMGLTGTPASWASAIATIAMHESGGNPSAINLTDSNAQAGHPSQGIMQTIPSTFMAYMLPGHSNILNPIDNIIAGIRYIKSRYGSVFNVPGIVSMAHGGGYVGYAGGTDFAPGGWGWVGEEGPERMYIPRGAQIIPNSRLAGGSTQSGGEDGRPIILQIDGRTFARGFMPYAVSEIQRNVGTHTR